MSIFIDGQRVESIGPTEPLSSEILIEDIKKMAEALESPESINNYWVLYMNDESAKYLEWYDQEWYKGPGLYQMYGEAGHPEFLGDGMMPMIEETPQIEFLIHDEVGTFNPPPVITDNPQSGKDKSDFFNKRKRKHKK